MTDQDSLTVYNEIISLNNKSNVSNTYSVIWLDEHTQENYQELVQKILCRLGNNSSILHNGIPGNSCYIVFAFDNFDYAMFLDRECHEDGQVVHITKRPKGFDYLTLWIV